ncbi:MAG: FAD-dependent oxidoreductase, partial [Verrucomicrobiota bacterium]
ADSVAYTFYFIDVHHDDGIRREFLKPGVVPKIPFGALIPKGSSHLLIAGRSVSSDRLANSAVRVQASCMAMGQVAGAAAALGVQLGCASKDVPVNRIKRLLKDHQAIVPSRADSLNFPFEPPSRPYRIKLGVA